MKTCFFPRLAWTGIRRNKQLYTPYLFTCIGMVMMLYIITSLSQSPMLATMRGGSSTQMVLMLGVYVVAVFSLIFLFYTNSFLIRRRNREFGLYNVLGMDKRGIGRIIAWESLLVAVISLVCGLALGIAFSKLAELALLKALQADVTYAFTVSLSALGKTALFFVVIFVLIFFNALRLVHKNDPLALLHSESVGEKPPRANWVLALLGVALLGGAYYLAITIQSPLAAMVLFFVAVIMVIIATYLLMISGSVTVCRLLQKKKSYYYKPSHFISVSSMVYRMKRNGAGLASVCILCTMVLVMICSTFSLFIGAEDSLKTRYSRDLAIELSMDDLGQYDDAALSQYRAAASDVLASHDAAASALLEYRYADIYGVLSGDRAGVNSTEIDSLYGNVTGFIIVPVEDLNRLTGSSHTLSPDEALIWCPNRAAYREPTLQIGDSRVLRVVGTAEGFEQNGNAAAMVMQSVYLFVGDYDGYVNELAALRSAGENALDIHWYCGFDTDADTDTQIAMQDELWDKVSDLSSTEEFSYSFGVYSRADNRADFYATYGGLFFIGILLSIVFIAAAVLIIYYKQVSEGYEDCPRFAIMKKVGMSDKAIRKSVNAQILTVFFAPLLFAGLHLAFASPMVWKLLQLFALSNVRVFIAVSVGAFLVFALCYVIVYRLTSNTYYKLVSSGESHRD